MKAGESLGSDGEWTVFNDFLVQPVSAEEVFSFPAQWKVCLFPKYIAHDRHPR